MAKAGDANVKMPTVDEDLRAHMERPDQRSDQSVQARPVGSTFAKKWPVPSRAGTVIGGDGAATKNLGTAVPKRSAGCVRYRAIDQRLRASGAAIFFCQSHVGPSRVA